MHHHFLLLLRVRGIFHFRLGSLLPKKERRIFHSSEKLRRLLVYDDSREYFVDLDSGFHNLPDALEKLS